MAEIKINVPTTADLPKDWHSTAFGLLAAIVTLVTAYVQTGSVSWQVALAAVAVAVICYFIPAKITLKDQLALAVDLEKLAADAVAKNIPAAVADAEALAAQVSKIVLATLSQQQAMQPPSPVAEDGAGAILASPGTNS